MPELPDLTIYVDAIRARAVGQALEGVRVRSPFLLRTVDPPLEAFTGRVLGDVRLLGKRLVFVFPDEHYLVLHLMIAGRLQWKKPGAPVPGKVGLCAFDFTPGTLMLTEAGSKRRASLHAVQGAVALAAMDPGGIDVMTASPEAFAEALTRERHTLKRALTDPRLFSGIGNAYSDEILHAAQLSPMRQTHQLSAEEIATLRAATRDTLQVWIDRFRERVGDGFPEKVTAFVEGMVAHGRYGQPCPRCGTPIQRLVYAQNEANYCPRCQTGGKLLADRALSRLLREDWPKSLEELEERMSKGRGTSDQ
ncbi:formamidopyrimidine-DNA glycosylase [Luteitalea sp. TBR-22]|uniref:DNA-formamidopyrimidine glycosylase family protein n=1 Tax=Luteitalea sp. TBR-22 TaxID=2802971 RepID=UPI001AFCABC3|nr:DNA-formamidopyrimidine glycosylase family protein [Luteitalea sp. TBR-22]BCS31528.1 formamidopyrimidine-DNA glycosylase [Luteitalea sp. TBR-22]